jgi:putative alpha-1,2-mannosidase
MVFWASDLQNERKFIVVANSLSEKNIYVQSATLNGKKWNNSWFQHSDIIKGAKLVFEMGPKPSNWGKEIKPPSISTKLSSTNGFIKIYNMQLKPCGGSC